MKNYFITFYDEKKKKVKDPKDYEIDIGLYGPELPVKVVNELRSIIAGVSCFCNLNKIVRCPSALYINNITKADAIYLIDRITEVLDRDVCAANVIAQ